MNDEGLADVSALTPFVYPDFTQEFVRPRLSLAKTLSDSLRSPEIRQSVHRPKTARLVGGRTTGIVRRWPCTVTPESRLEDGAWAGWAAELDR